MQSKGERETHTQLNTEFQRIARRDNKTFLNEQGKEMGGGGNRLGKSRDCFKKIGDIQKIFHARMGTKKDLKEMVRT